MRRGIKAPAGTEPSRVLGPHHSQRQFSHRGAQCHPGEDQQITESARRKDKGQRAEIVSETSKVRGLVLPSVKADCMASGPG